MGAGPGIVGLALLVAGAVADIAGAVPPIPWLDHPAVRLGGLLLAVAGVVLSFRAQAAMGDAWRGDVDPDVTNRLVTDGPFRWVRNPVLSGAALTSAGIALLVANPLALAGRFLPGIGRNRGG